MKWLLACSILGYYQRELCHLSLENRQIQVANVNFDSNQGFQILILLSELAEM